MGKAGAEQFWELQEFQQHLIRTSGLVGDFSFGEIKHHQKD